ncbi:MAG TPA: ABC transporter ATP-binding protein [Steroidobacteraceae bacterium]|nr:ABC transporter ATP-binding protein [Steroidobacteraceae bacterium]
MAEVVIRTQSLGKGFQGHSALHDFTADVLAGQVVGLVGKNGAGKSTLFDLLLGFALPTSGSSSLFGVDSTALSAAAKARIGFVPQSDELVGLMTGAQQLGLIASLHREWDQRLVDRLVREWELPLGRRISTLSGGERQKLSTLCALGHRPDLLVLDEPAASLDPVARRRFMQEILSIAGEATRTLLYASHLIGDLERVASHIWVLREGGLAWRGELDQLKESVVRLQVRADRELDPALRLPNQLRGSVAGRTATFTVGDWSHAQLGPLRQRLGAEVEVEPLELEEIFLALHA